MILGGIWFGAKGILIGQAVGGFVFALIALVLVRRVIMQDVLSMKQNRLRNMCGKWGCSGFGGEVLVVSNLD